MISHAITFLGRGGMDLIFVKLGHYVWGGGMGIHVVVFDHFFIGGRVVYEGEGN